MVGIGAFWVFMKIGPNSLSRALEDLAAVNHMTQAVYINIDYWHWHTILNQI